MTGATQAMAATPRGPKTRGTEWWTPPPDTPLNLAIPYVVQIVDDGLSLAQSRVLACITDLQGGAKRQTASDECKERGFLCDPGGHTKIARKTGLSRKTVYNAIQALIAKGVLRIWKVQMKGKQRVKTWYFALHYGDILPLWRSDVDFPDLAAGRNADGTWKKTIKLFHTAHKSSIVVRKRSKQFVSIEEGTIWSMNPARAPKRGCGRGLTEIAIVRPVSEGVAVLPPPAPIDNDEDVQTVYMELRRHCDGKACLKDAIDLIADARREATKMGYAELGYGGPFPCLTVAELLAKAAADYKPNRRYPVPTPGWFLCGSVRREVARLLNFEWEQKQG